ncbi:MAG TPA: hypothetical protein VFQ44_13920 [Streptosporangiaceae bacterium]|nr:hypothetical protein [Streptosporangiaceae bacterium]
MSTVKCVVWDLDNTLFQGIYLESANGGLKADRQLANALGELSGRGVLHAIASKNPPEAAEYATRLLGRDFAAVRCGWGRKPAAIGEIMTELGLVAGEVAFVDDDAMERAEVSFALPDVLVLEPRDVARALSWPVFSPPVVTDEGRRRGELYQQRRIRQDEARAFGGSPEDFLRCCGTRVRIAPAGAGDAARLHELSVRTHQFNSSGAVVGADEFAAMIKPGRHGAQVSQAGRQVIAVRLSDKFGDDGMVGGLIIAGKRGGSEPEWEVPLLMMSCRAIGRGVIDALLTWVCLAARHAGAGQVAVPCVINERNVPLRIALTGAGFRAGGTGPDRIARYARRLDQPLPGLPDWVTAEGAG